MTTFVLLIPNRVVKTELLKFSIHSHKIILDKIPPLENC